MDKIEKGPISIIIVGIVIAAASLFMPAGEINRNAMTVGDDVGLIGFMVVFFGWLISK